MAASLKVANVMNPIRNVRLIQSEKPRVGDGEWVRVLAKSKRETQRNPPSSLWWFCFKSGMTVWLCKPGIRRG